MTLWWYPTTCGVLFALIFNLCRGYRDTLVCIIPKGQEHITCRTVELVSKRKKYMITKQKNQTSKKKKNHAWEALQFLLFLTIYLHYKYILYLLNSDFSARWTKLNDGTKARTWMRLVYIHRVFHIILTLFPVTGHRDEQGSAYKVLN